MIGLHKVFAIASCRLLAHVSRCSCSISLGRLDVKFTSHVACIYVKVLYVLFDVFFLALLPRL